MTARRKFMYYIYWLEWKKRHLVHRAAAVSKRHERLLGWLKDMLNVFEFGLVAYIFFLGGLNQSTTAEGQEFLAKYSQVIPDMAMFGVALFGALIVLRALISFWIGLNYGQEKEY